MGLLGWVRGLFGKRGVVLPCALCHCAIPEADFAKGIAVVIARQQYCKGCVEEITRRAGHRNTPGWTLSADVGSSSTILLR